MPRSKKITYLTFLCNIGYIGVTSYCVNSLHIALITI